VAWQVKHVNLFNKEIALGTEFFFMMQGTKIKIFNILNIRILARK